jgi:hypothetical protein
MTLLNGYSPDRGFIESSYDMQQLRVLLIEWMPGNRLKDEAIYNKMVCVVFKILGFDQ